MYGYVTQNLIKFVCIIKFPWDT